MWDREVHSIARAPEGDDVAEAEEHDAQRVRPLRALRTVSERTDQDDEEQTQVQLEEYFKDVCTSTFRNEEERIIFLI